MIYDVIETRPYAYLIMNLELKRVYTPFLYIPTLTHNIDTDFISNSFISLLRPIKSSCL